jgi:hypothetical protein
MKHTNLTAADKAILDDYARIYQEHKALDTQLKNLRKLVDNIVANANADDLEEVIMETTDFIIPFATVSESLKFDYNVKKYLEETGAYNTVSVSIVDARKHLSTQQLSTYFNTVVGSRKIGKILVK